MKSDLLGSCHRGAFSSGTDGVQPGNSQARSFIFLNDRRFAMAETIFSSFETVKYEGPASEKALAYRWYDADRVVLGKSLKDHLRFSVAYWHSLAMRGGDPFGSATIQRPWFAAGAPIAQA
jgi:hypothetical protein